MNDLSMHLPLSIDLGDITVRDGLQALEHLFTTEQKLRLAEEIGIATADVAQGYAGCSALACGDLLLTADPSIKEAVTDRGGEVLSLSPGGIDLPGYDTGFIGGAGGYVDGHAVFFGDVHRHPDGNRIADALAIRGIVCHCLGDGPLTDFGGIKFFPINK